MNYTVSINEKKRTVTVTLADGTKGVAQCCPTDKFDINTGIELALERAKVAKANKSGNKTSLSVVELVKALEKALPKGQMVVVGNGDKLTEAQKKWLASLAGVNNACKCDCCDDCDESYNEGYAKGHDEGYDEGYDEGREKGYDEGYDRGYDEGYDAAEVECGMDEDTIANMVGEIEEVIASYL